jgi:hypothetical protein
MIVDCYPQSAKLYKYHRLQVEMIIIYIIFDLGERMFQLTLEPLETDGILCNSLQCAV